MGSGTDLRLAGAAVGCWLAAALAVGSGSGTVLRVAVGVAVVATVVWCAPLRRTTTARARATVGLSLVAVVTVLASCAAQLHAREAGPLDGLVRERAVVDVVGAVRAEPVPVRDRWAGPGTGDRFRTVLAIDELTGRGRTSPVAAGLVVIGEGWGTVPYGARVAVTGRLGPVDPGDESRGMLITWERPHVVRPPGAVDTVVGVFRAALLRVTSSLGPDARGLVPGSAIGDTSRVPPGLDQAMRDVGLTHITAVSGGHFAVLWVGVVAVCAVLRLPRAARAVVLATTMAGFVLLVHPEPSVLRAAAMGGVGVVGLLLGRPSAAVPALATGTVVLLVLDPWLARSYGFVLSVLATGAIVLLGPPLAAWFGRVLPRWASVVLAVPVAAQAVCAPVLVLLDPAVSVYAVPANALAAPALVPATLLGVLATVTAPWAGGVAVVLAHGAGWATWWIAQVARFFAGLPAALVPWAEGPVGAGLLAVATVGVLVLVLGPARGATARGLLAIAVVLALVPGARTGIGAVLPEGRFPAGWQVVMCDVGQGDGLVVRTGARSAIVIDVGPDGPAFDTCLDRLSVKEVDLLVLTHFHADHVGGLAPVLAGRTVRAALVSPLPAPAGQARRTLATLADAGVPVRVGAAGDTGSGGSGRATVRWTVLSPSGDGASVDGGVGRADEGDGDGANDASLVMLLESDELSVLALGDLEPAGQLTLAGRLPPEGIVVDVLKVAHHGSRYQSPRLAGLVDATVALISAGVGNDYGHPAGSTIGMLRDEGAVVLTTADCGDIAVGPSPGRERPSGSREVVVSASCLG